MTQPIVITLPLPSPDLSPNARVHWARKAREARKHRQWATLAALARKPLPRWAAAESQITFFVKDNRRRDADNYLAMCKNYLDGIAVAGVMIDDSGLRHKPVEFKVDKSDPRVEILIRPL